MSSNNTQRRNSIYSADNDPIPTSRYTFTPCTRLAQMSLHSTTTTSGRTRYFTCELKKPESLQAKLNRVHQPQQQQEHAEGKEYDDIDNIGLQHPNLSMVLDSRIRMSGVLSDLDEADESEDDGRLFSSPDNSPERDYGHQQQEQHQQHWLGSITVTTPYQDNIHLGLDDIFDDEPDEFLDTTGEWVNQIYCDDGDDETSNLFSESINNNTSNDDDVDVDVENRPPREWHSKKKANRLMGQVRGPLQEVLLGRKEHEEGPPRKKHVSSSLRFNRSLSPIHYRSNTDGSSS